MATLKELADLVQGTMVGNPDLLIKGTSTIDDGKPDTITFIGYKKYNQYANISKASAIIVEDKKLLNLIDQFNSKILPAMPVVAKDLIEKYHIPESKDLGSKLKLIEEKWVNNNFQLSSKQIDEIVNH